MDPAGHEVAHGPELLVPDGLVGQVRRWRPFKRLEEEAQGRKRAAARAFPLHGVLAEAGPGVDLPDLPVPADVVAGGERLERKLFWFERVESGPRGLWRAVHVQKHPKREDVVSRARGDVPFRQEEQRPDVARDPGEDGSGVDGGREAKDAAVGDHLPLKVGEKSAAPRVGAVADVEIADGVKAARCVPGEHAAFLLFRQAHGFRGRPEGASSRNCSAGAERCPAGAERCLALGQGTMRLIESFLRPDPRELASAAAASRFETAQWCLDRGVNPAADRRLAIRTAILARDRPMIDFLTGFHPSQGVFDQRPQRSVPLTIADLVLSYRMHFETGFDLTPADIKWALPVVLRYKYIAKFLQILEEFPADAKKVWRSSGVRRWKLWNNAPSDFVDLVLSKLLNRRETIPASLCERPSALGMSEYMYSLIAKRDENMLDDAWTVVHPPRRFDGKSEDRMRNHYFHLSQFEEWLQRCAPERIPRYVDGEGPYDSKDHAAFSRIFLYGFILPDDEFPLRVGEFFIGNQTDANDFDRWIDLVEDQSSTARFDRAWDYFVDRAGPDLCRYPGLLSMFLYRAVCFADTAPLRRITALVPDEHWRKYPLIRSWSPPFTESYFEVMRRKIWDIFDIYQNETNFHNLWTTQLLLPLDVLDERWLEVFRRATDSFFAERGDQRAVKSCLQFALSRNLSRSVGYLITQCHLRDFLDVKYVRQLFVTYRHHLTSATMLLFGYLAPRNRRRVFSVWWIPIRASKIRERVWFMMNGKPN